MLALLSVFSFNSHGLSTNVKKDVQNTMISYVNEMIDSNGFFPVVHEGKILQLSLKTSDKYPTAFHAGVKASGKLYASCADFSDPQGNKYDIDFLVSKNREGYKVIQPIVHSINGKKSKYDLEH